MQAAPCKTVIMGVIKNLFLLKTMQMEGSEPVRRHISYSSPAGSWRMAIWSLKIASQTPQFIPSRINTLTQDSSKMLSWHNKQDATLWGEGTKGSSLTMTKLVCYCSANSQKANTWTRSIHLETFLCCRSTEVSSTRS